MPTSAQPRRTTAGRRVGIGAALLMVVVLVSVAMALGVRNGTFSGDPFSLLSVTVLATYAGVGAFLVLRLPRNPLGWLFPVAGVGILWGSAGSGYAKYTLETNPGDVLVWVAGLGLAGLPVEGGGS
jgi:hypothetical protein